MRKVELVFLFCFWIIGLKAQNEDFKHDWDIKYIDNDIQFTSKKKAPFPFSTTGEPEAIMYVGASALDSTTKNDLNKIVKNEIGDIRKEISIADYLEEDYKAKDDIVSYFDNINNDRVAVIKYRTNGMKNGPRTMPRSTRQILFIHKGLLWVSSLIVLYGGHQENMRSDQMMFIKSILEKK